MKEKLAKYGLTGVVIAVLTAVVTYLGGCALTKPDYPVSVTKTPVRTSTTTVVEPVSLP